MLGDRVVDRGMLDSSTQPFDLRFLNGMILHHQGAVLMVQHMIADSGRQELRGLAQRITTTQQHDISQMRQWRQNWYGSSGSDMMAETMMEQMRSGGMMGQAPMQQMMGGTVDVDRMFLQMMIPHHDAAIAMAEQALTQAQHPEIKQLAQHIITLQRAEIAEMQRYLKDWYGIPE
jgi:uncharacterized protein (DUF305 family)